MSHLVNAALSLWMQIETSTNHDGWTENRDYSFASYAMMREALETITACFTDVDAQMYRQSTAEQLLKKVTLTQWEVEFVMQELNGVQKSDFFWNEYKQYYINLIAETKNQILHDAAMLRREQGI